MESIIRTVLVFINIHLGSYAWPFWQFWKSLMEYCYLIWSMEMYFVFIT